MPRRPKGQVETDATQPTRSESLTIRVRPDVLARAKKAVIVLAGTSERLTLASFAERAFEHECERLEKRYNGGKPFEIGDDVRLPVGRPVKLRER